MIGGVIGIFMIAIAVQEKVQHMKQALLEVVEVKVLIKKSQ